MKAQPDFVKLAEAYGAVGLRADKPADVKGVIKAAMKEKKRPVIMDFTVNPLEGVYPMVPSGQPISNMLLV
jgi:acetolactate synthase-1/2/3 large subunit